MKLPKYIQKYLAKKSNRDFLFNEIQKTLPVDFEEFSLLSAAFRYYMGSSTASAVTFPSRFITHFYPRLSEEQRRFFCNELKVYVARHNIFGMVDIDHPIWMKLYHALDSKTHKTYTLIDGSQHTCFQFNGRIYPLNEYLLNPYHETYLSEDIITNKS